MPVILQSELADLIVKHDQYMRGVRGGRRLDLSMQTGHELDFSKNDLSSAEFVGAFLNHANFSYCKLRQTNFFGATMDNGNYFEADLSQADLRGAQMRRVNFTNAVLDEANLSDGLLLRHERGGGIGSPVQNADPKLRLSDAVFKNATAQRAKFSSAIELSTNLCFANFKGAKLNGVNFQGSNLHGVSFENADLRGCNFTNSNMSSTVLLHSNLEGAVFDGTDLTACLVHTEDFAPDTFNNAKMTRSLENLEHSIKEIIAEHRVWVNTLGREGKRADLVGINLANVLLDGVQLQAASLQKALLDGASFANSTFTMSDLSDSNACGASFEKADCRGVNFAMSRLDSANLQYADFSAMPISRSLNPTCWPANFSGANLQQAYMRGANLKGANLEKAFLVGADLRDTNLDGAVFLDANLTNVDLRGAQTDKADFRGAVGVR